MKKRILAFLMCFALAGALLPMGVLAATDVNSEGQEIIAGEVMDETEEEALIGEDAVSDMGEDAIVSGIVLLDEASEDIEGDAVSAIVEEDAVEDTMEFLSATPEEEEPEAEELEEEEEPEDEEAIMPLASATVSTADAFKAAVESAEDGDTITLDGDIEVSGSGGDFVEVTSAVTVDLNGHTISVSDGSAGNSLFEVKTNGSESEYTFTVKNGTLDGSSEAESHAIYLEKGSNASLVLEGVTIRDFAQTAVYVDGSTNNRGGDVYVTGCTFTGNEHNEGTLVTAGSGAGIFMEYSGSLTITGSTFSSNKALSYGGGVFLYYTIGDVVLEGNTFDSNSANFGGGFSAEQVEGNMTISGNTITNNTALYKGGGFHLNNVHSGSLTLTGNTVSYNEVTYSGEYEGYGGGGGSISNSSTYTVNVQFTDNTFSYNRADNSDYPDAKTEGGALLFNNKDSDSEIVISSGYFYENSAQVGGAISYYQNGKAPLVLYNASITGNTAQNSGGGLWFCPNSEVEKSVTMGVAIYGNTAVNGSGDDIRYEGIDTEDEDLDPSESTFVQLSYRALGGTLMEWYTDEAGARYTDGTGTLYDYDDPIFTGTNLSFGAHAELSEKAIALAEEEAALYIYDNYASDIGGGIAANNPVVFGADTDLVVTATKVWTDKDGNVLTGQDIENFSVDVTLIRVDEDGNEVELETVTMNEENNWEWNFRYLPTEYIGKDELVHEYTYTTREITHVDCFSPSYEIETDEYGDEQITITNREQEFYDIDEEIVGDMTDIFNTDKYEKRESVNEYNAIEIEMSTYLPYITGQDLIDSVYTINFHNVLDSELVLDEADADFSVYIAGREIDHKYYTVTISADDGCNFHVDVDLSALYADGVIDESNLQGDTLISVFFFVDLEGTGLNGTYKSTVWYEVYENDTVVYTSNTDVIEVYTFEIEIQKIDDDTGDVLPGAVFGLYYDEDCSDAVSRNEEEYTVVSDQDGMAIFYGLAGGIYYLSELEAPDGYVLSEEVAEVVLREDTVQNYAYALDFVNMQEKSDLNIGADDEFSDDHTADTDAVLSPKTGDGSNLALGFVDDEFSGDNTADTDAVLSPKTGDERSLSLWLVLLCCSAACLVGLKSVSVKNRARK